MSEQPPSLPIREDHSIKPDAIPMWVFGSTEPIILRGLVADWPLVKLGNKSSIALIDELKSRYAGEPALAYFGDDASDRRLAYNSDLSALNFAIRKSSLNELLNELAEAVDESAMAGETVKQALPVRYIASNIIDYYFPGLREHNDLSFDNEYFQQHPLEGADPMAGIWIGNQTISPCHFDAQNNIACCVAGERRVTLFPPSQIENLYPGPLHLNPGGQAITLVDFDAPDFDRYPKFKKALMHRRTVLLKPGDALFIPVMWWHQVASLSPFNVLINYWWNSFPKMAGQAMAVMEHALLSLRHRAPEERAAWRAIFDYYIFGDSHAATAHLPDHAQGPLGALDEESVRRLRSRIIGKLNC